MSLHSLSLFSPFAGDGLVELDVSLLDNVNFICGVSFLKYVLPLHELLLLGEIYCDSRQFMRFEVLMHDRVKELYFLLEFKVLD